jgi:hypothetical protein
MTEQDYLDLADRVEAATGPDRSIDYLVMTATVPTGHAYLWDPNDQSHRYTSSADASRHLLPVGWAATIDHSYPGPGVRVTAGSPDLDPAFIVCTAATFALAMLAAVLRARAHASRVGDGRGL